MSPDETEVRRTVYHEEIKRHHLLFLVGQISVEQFTEAQDVLRIKLDEL